MDTKYICKECKHEVTEKSNFCPHCGKRLEMVNTTYKISVEVVFTEKPTNCRTCRFGKDGIDGCCILDQNIIFKNYHKNKYYGFWGSKIKECPIKI